MLQWREFLQFRVTREMRRRSRVEQMYIRRLMAILCNQKGTQLCLPIRTKRLLKQFHKLLFNYSNDFDILDFCFQEQ